MLVSDRRRRNWTSTSRQALSNLRSGAYWRKLSEPQLFGISFLIFILIGTAGFLILPGLYTGPRLTFLDALFTATSAICVTGLIVVDTATYFTPFGHAYILFLVQLGGLGVITFTVLIISALGLRLSLRQESISRSTTQPAAPHIDNRRLTVHIVTFTLLTEAIGALLLYIFWIPEYGVGGAWWPAVFHAISAFCNAGFALFSDSLIGFREHPGILTVVMILVVIGGIGFLVIEELYLLQKATRRGHTFRLSLHSRIVLITTGVLVFGAWLLFAVFEWNVSLAALPWVHKVTNALFMSVTRTAGFSTIDYAHAANNSDFLTILLMAIGGSPGSVAGGMKTTTFAVIGLLAWSRLRGYRITSVGGRSVPEETVQRAIGIFVLVFSMITGAIFIFTSTEIGWVGYTDSAGFLPIMFEAASAFGTVGLSMGVTPDLSDPGRVTTVILMFVGRVGPLTFAAALARRRATRGAPFHYAYEDVGLG